MHLCISQSARGPLGSSVPGVPGTCFLTSEPNDYNAQTQAPQRLLRRLFYRSFSFKQTILKLLHTQGDWVEPYMSVLHTQGSGNHSTTQSLFFLQTDKLRRRPRGLSMDHPTVLLPSFLPSNKQSPNPKQQKGLLSQLFHRSSSADM